MTSQEYGEYSPMGLVALPEQVAHGFEVLRGLVRFVSYQGLTRAWKRAIQARRDGVEVT